MILKMKKKIKRKTKNVQKEYSKIRRELINFFKEKGKRKKVKKLLQKIWHFIIQKEVLCVFIMLFSFAIMDLVTRLIGGKIDFYRIFSFTPRFFSISYIILFLGIILNIKKRQGKILYSVIFFLFLLLFLVQNIYYSTMNNYFSFSLIALASEGSSYFLDAVKNANIWIYIVFILLIIGYTFTMRFYPNGDTLNKKKIRFYIILFLFLHFISKLSLGSANFELTWDNWQNPRNVYNNFNDANKCMSLSGIYEYTIRDFFVTYIRSKDKKSVTESNFLDEVFSENNDNFHQNKYTGIFKDKNVIFLQLEGIDDWLLTKDLMPNAYSLLNNSFVFTNHYSYYNGGGSTFNSEFMVNVGYMTPFTYPMNAYTLNKNDFPYSMANLMKKENYSIKAFHMNSKEYYSRGINYFNWGYDNYFGLKDLGVYEKNAFHLDRELVLNETFNNEMFNGNSKFVDYVITYSTHMPFTSAYSVCRQLLNHDYEEEMNTMESDEYNQFIENLNLTEEDCIKRQAKETDYMIGLLMNNLKEKGLYDNTVIVAYADHYLYTVNDREILKRNGKDLESNLINHTPFFIWSSNTKKQEINKLTSQINILPTVLNLLGINYNDKWYIGKDVLDNNYNPMLVFVDMSWYDGTYYVKDGEVINNKKIDSELLEQKNSYAEYLVKKNDLVLKYNYFKEIVN